MPAFEKSFTRKQATSILVYTKIDLEVIYEVVWSKGISI